MNMIVARGSFEECHELDNCGLAADIPSHARILIIHTLLPSRALDQSHIQNLCQEHIQNWGQRHVQN